MKHPVVLIKLGGSIITNKDQRKEANLEKISQLAKELKEASRKSSDLMILGHGVGSFSHPPAHKFRTKEGFINKNSAYGLAEVRKSCLEINLIVISKLIEAGLPATTLVPFSFLTADNKKLDKVFLSSLVNTLEFRLLPVIHGDVISDRSIGCTIYSTETLLNILAIKLGQHGYYPKVIIEIVKPEGVYDQNGQTIPEINKKNFQTIKSRLTGSESIDVTGGMLHKVEEAYQMAKKGVSTLITSSAPGNLKKAILGQKVEGTWIKY